MKKVGGVSERELKKARNEEEVGENGSTIPPRYGRGGHRDGNQEVRYSTGRREEKKRKKKRAQKTASEKPTHVLPKNSQRKLRSMWHRR